MALTPVLTSCGSTKKAEAQRANDSALSAALLNAAERDKALAKQTADQIKQKREDELKALAFREVAAKRNAEKIKSLGFPSNFLASSIYVRGYSGKYDEFMPVTHWLGLLFENKDVSSISYISENGQPGVFIKKNGIPGDGFVFRMEINEAYPQRVISNGQTKTVHPEDHSWVMSSMLRLTKETSKK